MCKMRSSHLSAGNERETVGIILAGNNNLHLWPLSRISEPIQFKRLGDGFSPFQRSLQALNTVRDVASTFVTVSATCIDLARQQIAELRLDKVPHLIVEPVERGDLSGLLAALIIAADLNRNACAIVLDANQPPTDNAGFLRLLNKFRTMQIWEKHPVLFCAQVSDVDTSIRKMQVGAELGHDHLFHPRDADNGGKHWVAADPAMILLTPRLWGQMCCDLEPGSLEKVSAAVQASHEMNGCSWPDVNLWSALPFGSLSDAFTGSRNPTLVRPADFTAKSLHRPTQSSDFEIIGDGHLIALSGCSEIVEIITTPDATLVRPRNGAHDPTKVIEVLRGAERPELHDPETRLHSWGKETIKERGDGFAVSRLEIAPGQNMDTHFHNHRRETWHVLSGSADAVLDRDEYRLTHGNALEIPRNTIHGLTNNGTQPLVLLEIRHGAYLFEADHIRTAAPQAAQLSVV